MLLQQSSAAQPPPQASRLAEELPGAVSTDFCADCEAMDGAGCFASAGFNASGGGEVGGAVTTADAVGAGTIAARSADGSASAAAPSNRDASIAFDQAELPPA